MHDERFSSGTFQGGVDAGYDALPACFFVTCGPVDLSGHEQARQYFRFQRMVQLGGVKIIVFYGIARTVYAQIAESRDFFQGFDLDVEWQAR